MNRQTTLGVSLLVATCLSCSNTDDGAVFCQGFSGEVTETRWIEIVTRERGGMPLNVVVVCMQGRQYYLPIVPTSGGAVSFTAAQIKAEGYGSPEHLANDLRRWFGGDVQTAVWRGIESTMPADVEVRVFTPGEIERFESAMTAMDI